MKQSIFVNLEKKKVWVKKNVQMVKIVV